MRGWSKDVPNELVTFSEQFRSGHWKWRGRVRVLEGVWGRRRGDGGGGEDGLFVLSMPSRPGSVLDSIGHQTKIFERRAPNGREFCLNMVIDHGIT